MPLIVASLDVPAEHIVDSPAALTEGERRLREVLAPEATDARAKRRQAEILAQYGGREKALARGDLGFTPASGTAAEIN